MVRTMKGMHKGVLMLGAECAKEPDATICSTDVDHEVPHCKPHHSQRVLTIVMRVIETPLWPTTC